MAAPRFLDTNILLRALTRDEENKAQAAKALLERVEREDEKVVSSAIVVFETVYTLERFYKIPRPIVAELLINILGLRGLQIPNKSLLVDALNLYAVSHVSFADAYHSVYCRNRGIAQIYSWDTDFDRLDGPRRVEPKEELPEAA
jgi:predicted nucleic acid-binding protein